MRIDQIISPVEFWVLASSHILRWIRIDFDFSFEWLWDLFKAGFGSRSCGNVRGGA